MIHQPLGGIRGQATDIEIHAKEILNTKKKLNEMLAEEIEIPIIVGGREIRTGNTAKQVCPHDHQHVLATYHQAGAEDIKRAIDVSVAAQPAWDRVGAEERDRILNKAADLFEQHRDELIPT